MAAASFAARDSPPFASIAAGEACSGGTGPQQSSQSKSTTTSSPPSVILTHADIQLRSQEYKRPTRSSWVSWIPTDDQQLAATEAALLVNLKTPFIQRHVVGLNTLTITVDHHRPAPHDLAAASSGAEGERDSDSSPLALRERHILLIHGFGAGLAMWMPNLDALAKVAKDHEDTRLFSKTVIHAIDMPGFARSERRWQHIGGPDDSVKYMVDWLEEWLFAMNILSKDRIRLEVVGHSFGAFISAQLAMKRPDIVSHLFLADPWGVPVLPPEHSTGKMPLKFRVAMKFFYFGLPFATLRMLGPMGPKALPAVRKDFAERWAPYLDDVLKFFDYVYHCNASNQAVGELVFQKLCEGPVFSQRPLIRELPVRLSPDMDFTIVYGRRTWMQKKAGLDMLHALMSNEAAAGSDTPVSHARREYFVLNEAGHQINTDNAEGFGALLATAIWGPAAQGDVATQWTNAREEVLAATS